MLGASKMDRRKWLSGLLAFPAFLTGRVENEAEPTHVHGLLLDYEEVNIHLLYFRRSRARIKWKDAIWAEEKASGDRYWLGCFDPGCDMAISCPAQSARLDSTDIIISKYRFFLRRVDR